MPNEKILSEKKAVVDTLTAKLKSQAGVLVDYSGVTVAEDTEMRAKLRAENVDYSVVKNTLMRFAIKNVGLDELDPILNGTTSLAVSVDDPVAPARLIKEYSTKFENHFFIKGGFMDGKALSVDEINALADIPPMPMLYAQLLGTMLAPISQLAAVIKAIAEKSEPQPDSAA
jgi:large subunit ribosomal protein L10